MAKAKNKKAAFLENHPNCCFCGGGEPATTIDHTPPSIFFEGKQRPNGFEFPACERCNTWTGAVERVVALIARIFPEADTQKRPDEVKGLLGAVHRTNPGLLKEMRPSLRQQRNYMKDRLGLQPGRDGPASEVPIWNLDGPRVRHCMDTFGRKLTCAVHYYLTGRIIPPDGAIWVKFTPNANYTDSSIPESFLNILGDPKTLKQGSVTVEDQFAIRMAQSPDPRLSAYFAKFRLSFALIGFVHCEPPEDFGPGNAEGLHPFDWRDDQAA